MRTLVYRGPRVLTLEQAEVPSPAPGEIVVRVEAVGICGSELEGYLGHSSVRVPPLVMGHEFAGEVAFRASDADRFDIGAKVVVNPLLACGACDRCREGRPNICRDRRIVGIHRPGAFAEYVAVPEACAIAVPQAMDSATASLAEPLAVCIHAAKLGLAPFGDALVFGAGPIGLLTVQALRRMGARRILAVDRQPARLAFAERLGAAVSTPDLLDSRYREVFGSAGSDTVIDCVGVESTRQQALALVNPGGKIVLVGLGHDRTTLPLNHAVRQEVSLIGSYTYTAADFDQAVALLASGAVTREGWTALCGLGQASVSFATLADGTNPNGKIIVDPRL